MDATTVIIAVIVIGIAVCAAGIFVAIRRTDLHPDQRADIEGAGRPARPAPREWRDDGATMPRPMPPGFDDLRRPRPAPPVPTGDAARPLPDRPNLDKRPPLPSAPLYTPPPPRRPAPAQRTVRGAGPGRTGVHRFADDPITPAPYVAPPSPASYDGGSSGGGHSGGSDSGGSSGGGGCGGGE